MEPDLQAFLASTKEHRRDLIKVAHAHAEAHIEPAIKRALSAMLTLADDPAHATTVAGVLFTVVGGKLLAIQDTHLKVLAVDREHRHAGLQILLEAALKMAVTVSDRNADELGRKLRPDGTTYEEPRT